MGKFLIDNALDAILDYIADNGNEINICSAEPTTYTEAHTTYMLAQGSLTPGDGNGDFTIGDGDASGRKLTVEEQESLPISNTGDATHIAIVKTGTSTLLYVTTCTLQGLTSGGTVDIPAFDIEAADVT